MGATASDINEYAKELIIARLGVLPPNISIAVGSEGSFTREQLIQHVEDEDDIGKKFVEIELDFLKSLKEGTLFG
jgi:hypothetical protein